MKPCVIISRFTVRTVPTCFIAINQDGLSFGKADFDYQELREHLLNLGYTVVSHNSRIGRTILDKVEGRFIT